jgi:uncharacterized protein YegL
MSKLFSFQQYSVVRIHPPDVSEPRSFHLALLLDTSGSMEGSRLAALKRTLHILVDHLKETDCLTIIEYNSQADILAECVGDKQQLHTLVDSLRARGGTCMESAILQLVPLTRTPGFRPLQAIFLMTDGYVNAGIQSLTGLSQLLTSLPRNVPIHTLGFGEHQATLLQGLAMPSRGTYSYAEEGEMLPTVIGSLVGGLSEESMVGVSLDVPQGLTCLELGPTQDGKYLVGNLVANKPQWVVLTGSCNSIRMSWEGGEAILMQQEPTSVEEVEEQIFRARAVKLFLDARTGLKTLGDLTLFEHELDSSRLMNRPLLMRLKAQLYEVIETLKQPVRHQESQSVSRLLSNVTTFGIQRGVLVPTTSGAPASRTPDPLDFFASPTQRQVSQQMTAMYTQHPDCHDPN